MKVSEYSRAEPLEEAVPPPPEPRQSELPSRYQPSRQTRWISLGIITALHVAGILALPYLDVEFVRRAPTPPLVVDLLPLNPPPSKPLALPAKMVVVKAPESQRVVAPPPIVKTPAQPLVIHTTPKPEPAEQASVKVEQVSSAPIRPAVTATSLSTQLLSANPPNYPAESRRRRETGTVVLLVVIDEKGRVSAISVAESSGAERLDKAALNAVRNWRWSPMIVEGQPIQVRGLVRIPFKLKDNP